MRAHRGSALALINDECFDCSRDALELIPGAPRAGLQV
jgi:hypothetical protein